MRLAEVKRFLATSRRDKNGGQSVEAASPGSSGACAAIPARGHRFIGLPTRSGSNDSQGGSKQAGSSWAAHTPLVNLLRDLRLHQDTTRFSRPPSARPGLDALATSGESRARGQNQKGGSKTRPYEPIPAPMNRDSLRSRPR